MRIAVVNEFAIGEIMLLDLFRDASFERTFVDDISIAYRVCGFVILT